MGVAEDIKEDLNRGAFRLFAEYRSSLYSEALQLCLGNQSDAEDLTIRTLDRAIRKIAFFDESKGRVIDWMRQIMRNLRKNDLDLKAANAVVAFDPTDMEASLGQADSSTVDDILSKSDDEFLRRAVNALPNDLREAVVLHYLMDQPIAQVAKVLRVPVGTVKARLHYARKVLQGKLAKEMRRPRTIAAMALFLLSTVTYAAWTAGWIPHDLFGGAAEAEVAVAPVVEVAAKPSPFPVAEPQTNATSTALLASESAEPSQEETSDETAAQETGDEAISSGQGAAGNEAQEPPKPFRIRIR